MTSRSTMTVRFSPYLLAVALTPVFLQVDSMSCTSGDTTLSEFELIVQGENRLLEFDPDQRSYMESLPPGTYEARVQTLTTDPQARAWIDVIIDGERFRYLHGGSGGSDLVVSFPPGSSVLEAWVRAPKGATDYYSVAIETDDSNSDPLVYEDNPHSAKYDFSEVDSVVDALLAANPQIEGATLAVVRKDESQIYEAAYGAFERDRVSHIASTGKILSVAVILAMADEGLVDMDRPVTEYLNWGYHRPMVTLRNILSMMSGIPGSSGSASYPFACRDDPSTTLQDCAKEVFQDETSSIPPGQEFRYSGPAWQIPGAAAEIVTGFSWADLVEQQLTWHCGLTATGFWNRGGGGYPSDFNGDPESLPHTDNPSLGGGVYTTVNDYSKVLLMHLQGGLCGNVRVLSESSVEAMQEDLVPEGLEMPSWAPGAVNYGMGWWKFQNEPNLLIDAGRFGAQAYLDPVEGWGAIVIIEANVFGGSAQVLRQTLVPAIRSVLAGAG